ncbi:MAG: DUF2520 domain-containing protein [Clostridiales bacterium]|nr:DUF2520 domain-containing protein [Clostridiales bacterium]
MKTGFIGAGKAGTSLGIYFKSKEIPIAGYYSKSIESSKQAADFTKSTAFSDLEELIAKSDMIFITTPDRTIGQVAQTLSENSSKYDLNGKHLCHLSGSLSSESLLCASDKCASAHPMIAISSRKTDLSEAPFTIEGQPETVSILKSMLTKCGNIVTLIETDKKGSYHCAASIASNLMVALAELSINKLQECGFSRQGALHLLTPLMKSNIDAVCEKGTEQALTGPIERGDEQTIRTHLEGLEGNSKEIYRLLSLELVDIAREKNKNRNYSELQELLEEKNEEHSSYIQKGQGR